MTIGLSPTDRAAEAERKTKTWNEDSERAARLADENRAEIAQKAETEAAAESPSRVYGRLAQAKAAASGAASAYGESPMSVAAATGFIASLEAVKDAADTFYRVARYQADNDIALAVRQAADGPVGRERARAEAMQKHADSLGRAEIDLEDAKLAFDRGVVSVAQNCKIQAARVELAKAQLAEMQKGETDVFRLTNPFADPIRPKITESQYNSIRDPALKARAGKEADIIKDPVVPWGKADALSILRSRGSAGRQVLTRSEFAALSGAEKVAATKSAILVDDE